MIDKGASVATASVRLGNHDELDERLVEEALSEHCKPHDTAVGEGDLHLPPGRPRSQLTTPVLILLRHRIEVAESRNVAKARALDTKHLSAEAPDCG